MLLGFQSHLLQHIVVGAKFSINEQVFGLQDSHILTPYCLEINKRGTRPFATRDSPLLPAEESGIRVHGHI